MSNSCYTEHDDGVIADSNRFIKVSNADQKLMTKLIIDVESVKKRC